MYFRNQSHPIHFDIILNKRIPRDTYFIIEAKDDAALRY